jgi:hypothetical protein
MISIINIIHTWMNSIHNDVKDDDGNNYVKHTVGHDADNYVKHVIHDIN